MRLQRTQQFCMCYVNFAQGGGRRPQEGRAMNEKLNKHQYSVCDIQDKFRNAIHEFDKMYAYICPLRLLCLGPTSHSSTPKLNPRQLTLYLC